MGESFGGRTFGHVPIDSGFQGVLDVDVVLVSCEHDDAGGGGLPADVAGGVESVEVWHGDVEGDDIGLEFGGLEAAFAPIGSLADDFGIPVFFEDADQCFAHHLMVINDED